MDFYIDLKKAMLNFAKLVKKPVQVKGKNGKVFTRMQWVSPAEASTGHGIRQISTRQGLEQAKQDGIHHHPDYEQAMKDQGVHEDTFENHHPHFFLPETEHSVKNHQKRIEDLENEHGFLGALDNADHEFHYPHGMKPSDSAHNILPEHFFVPKSHEEGKEEQEFLAKHGISPEIHETVGHIENLDTTGQDASDTIYNLSKHISRNAWPTIKSSIKDKIEQDFAHAKEGDDDMFIKRVQLNALENGNMNHSLNAAHHPEIAKATVNKILGEHTANQWRSHMKDGALSINFPGMWKESIVKDGYKSSQLTDFLKKNIGEHAIDQLNEVLSKHEGTEAQLDAVSKLVDHDGDESSWVWSDVVQRANAEYDAIGLELEDRKPTYIALNPMGEVTGGAPYYGNRWLKVNEGALRHCTATFDDSFNESRSVAKVWSLDHLKDMFILKQLFHGQANHGYDEETGWAFHKGDIPIELQYHKPDLKPDEFELVPDVSETQIGIKAKLNDGDAPEGIDDLDMPVDDFKAMLDKLFPLSSSKEQDAVNDDNDDLDLGDLDDLEDFDDWDLLDDDD